MDPLSMIVAALATGAAAVASSAVGDAYAAVKTLLRQRFDGVALETLEQNPKSAPRQEVVKEDLDTSGAARDEEFLQLVQQLLGAIEKSGAGSGPVPAFDLEHVRAAELVIKRIVAEGPSTAILRGHDVEVTGMFEVSDVTVRSTESGPKA